MLSKFHKTILLNIAAHLNRWLWTGAMGYLLCGSLWAQDNQPVDAPKEKPVNEQELVFSEGEQATEQAEPPAPQAPRQDSNLIRQQLLAEELPQNTEAVWLNVGGNQRLALWRPDQSGKPLGAVLILHDDDRQQNQPAYLENLALILPDYGWATLSISLPAIPPASVPSRPNRPAATTPPDAPESPTEPVDETKVVFDEDKAENSNSANTTEPTEDSPPEKISTEAIEAQAQTAIGAALRALNDKGQYNVAILGEALGAVRAIRFLNDATPQTGQVLEKNKAKAKVDKPIRAVILLNGRNRWPRLGVYVPDMLTFSDIPTLDLYEDDLKNTRQAQLRKQSAQRQKFQHYVLKAHLPAPLPADRFQETTLTKTVRGFLNRYAKGVELK